MSSCGSKEFDSEEALWAYIKDPENAYLQEKTVNGVDFTLLYKPTDLIVAQEIGSKDATTKEIDSLRNKYNKYAYFNLSISKSNQEILNSVAGDRNQFGAMVNTLSFGMEDKMHMYSNKRDTIALLDYVYPRMYGMSKSTSLLLVYSAEELEKYTHLNLSVEDMGLGTGEVRIKLNPNSLKKRTQINF